MQSVDTETGEVKDEQLVLDPVLFKSVPRKDVPTFKISFGGTIELTRTEFAEYFPNALEPGRCLTMEVHGYMPNPHTKWAKHKEPDPLGGPAEEVWEPEGVVKVTVTDMGEPTLGGIWSGE